MEETLKILGIHCEGCSLALREGLNKIKVKAKVSSNLKIVNIIYDEDKINIEAIKNKILELGFKVE